MSVKGFEFEGLMLRSKVPIPFVEENYYLPQKVFVEGYFPVGTIFQFRDTICSKKQNYMGDQVNDYCHAAALLYSNRFNGADESEIEQQIIFHVDLSALFLMLDPIDENGNVTALRATGSNGARITVRTVRNTPSGQPVEASRQVIITDDSTYMNVSPNYWNYVSDYVNSLEHDISVALADVDSSAVQRCMERKQCNSDYGTY
mgnify:CR=1 FL=1